MFEKHEDLVAAVLTASQEARRGLEDWPDRSVWVKNHHTMIYNEHTAAQLLQRQDQGSAGWTNDAVLFLFNEFVSEEHGVGASKSLTLDSCKQDVFIRYGGHEGLLQLVERAFLPFVQLYSRLQVWRARHKGRASSCLVLTALPLEFRAIMRRLAGLSEVRAFPNPSRSRVREGQELFGTSHGAGVSSQAAFSHVYDKKMDGRVPRDFWLLVEGVVGTGPSETKVGIVLLPQYGGHEAQSLVMLAHEQLRGYQEVLVVGVAGRLHDHLAIGDVVVSNRIFDGTLSKRVPDSKGGEIFVNKDDPWEWNSSPRLPNVDDVIALIKEEVPGGLAASKSRGGFSRIVETDVVSASTLSKSSDFKKRLNDRFPSCGALEMEALGCCAAHRGQVIVRVIKGLCDKADFTKSKEWQPYCADAAAAVAVGYIQLNYGQYGRDILNFAAKKAKKTGGRRVSSSDLSRATSG